MLALNPNDTDAHPGKEEQEMVIPAIQKLSDAGVCVFGPYQSEKFFGDGGFMAFDAVVSMYWDQGLAPMKALCPDGNVHYLAGLPIDAFRARHDFDEPYANPLPKIYKERKDDSEKARFAIPKKHSFHKDGEKGGNAGANGTNA